MRAMYNCHDCCNLHACKKGMGGIIACHNCDDFKDGKCTYEPPEGVKDQKEWSSLGCCPSCLDRIERGRHLGMDGLA